MEAKLATRALMEQIDAKHGSARFIIVTSAPSGFDILGRFDQNDEALKAIDALPQGKLDNTSYFVFDSISTISIDPPTTAIAISTPATRASFRH
jgi:hypothetical protein